METTLPNPALAADAPAVLEQRVPTPETVATLRSFIAEKLRSVLYYGLLAFGLLFPVAATIYARIVY
jgi:hypothetical protein